MCIYLYVHKAFAVVWSFVRPGKVRKMRFQFMYLGFWQTSDLHDLVSSVPENLCLAYLGKVLQILELPLSSR